MTADASRSASVRGHDSFGDARPFAWPDAIAVVGLMFIALFVYRPTAAGALDYVDFPAIVQALKRGGDFSGGYHELIALNRTLGRWSPTVEVLLSAQWQWFGWEATGWQVTRFILMFANTAVVYALYRRLELNVGGSFFSAALTIVAPGAIMGWTRPSTLEPVGLLFLLAGAHLAVRPFSPRARWGMALMAVGTIWSKEMMLASWVLPVFIAWLAIERSELPRLKTLVTTFAPTAALLIVGAIPILHAFFAAPTDAFATQYGTSSLAVSDIAGSTATAILPFSPGGAEGESSGMLPLAALVLLLVLGWPGALLNRTTRRRRLWILAISLALPLVGAVVFAPWPYYQLIYALPYLVAGALLVGQPTSSLIDEGGWRAAAAIACVAVIVSFAAFQATNDTSRTRAVQQAIAETVRQVSARSDVDTALFTVADNQFDPDGNFGIRFESYAEALDVRWPVIRDIRCHDVPAPVPARNIVVLMSVMCRPPGDRPAAVAYERLLLRWPDPRSRTDTVSVLLLSPDGR